VLAGISDLEGLRNALEKADVGYLERLQGKAWIVSGPFLVLLMLIYNARERITTEFLIARGFDEDIAQRIVSALDKNQAK